MQPRIIAAGVALALLVAATAGSLNDVEDELAGADELADVCDVLALATPYAVIEAPPELVPLAAWRRDDARSTGCDVAHRIFRPPI
jgi:hypothetical protein